MCSGIENLLRTALFVKEPEAVSKLQRKHFPNYKNTEKSLPGKEKGLSCFSLCGIIYHIIFVFDGNCVCSDIDARKRAYPDV